MFKKSALSQALFGLTVVTVSGSSVQVVAATSADEAYIRQQQQQQQLDQTIRPQPEVHLDQLQQPVVKPVVQDYLKDHAESPCFEIKEVKLVGEQAGVFSFAASALTAGEQSIIGKCLGVNGLNQALDIVQNKIIERGYVTTRVLLPSQNLKDGTLSIQVIPGKIASIQTAPDTSWRFHQWNALPMGVGDLLNIRDLEQGLENFKRVPTVEADIKLQPSTVNNAPGMSDVLVAWQQSKPYRLNASVDDSGSKSTGKYQGSATLSLDNLLTLNDLFYVSVNHDLGGGNRAQKKDTDGYTFSYTIPMDYWLLTTSYNQFNYLQTVAGASQSYQYSGDNKTINADLSRVIYRDAHRKTSVSFGGYFREQHNFIDDTEIEVQRRRTAGWQAGIAHTEYVGANTVNLKLDYKHGTGAWSSLPAPEESFKEAYSRAGIVHANANIQVPFKVGATPMQYTLDMRAQFTNKPLTSQDKFSLGGRYTVRGFDGEQTLLGDQGYLIRNEFSGAIGATKQWWYTGFDYGAVSSRRPELSPVSEDALAGAVLGLRGGFQQFQYDLFVGTPVSKPDYLKTSRWTTGFSLSFSY